MRNKYTDEFKLDVIRDYYTNKLGIRTTAKKWGLPSKNYITKWEAYLSRRGLIPPDLIKKAPLSTLKTRNATDTITDDSIALELAALRKQNEELRCALEFEREVNKLLGLKKK